MNSHIPGWTDAVDRRADIAPRHVVARVTGQEKDLYTVFTETGPMPARVAGRMMHEATGPMGFPAVGDWVAVEAGTDLAIIHAILPRHSVLERKSAGTTSASQIIAANVDVVFICMSANENYHLRRLERYLAVVWASGATPCVVLTKTDLADDLVGALEGIVSVAPGVDVLSTSDRVDHGYNAVERRMESGRTHVFIGSSGVGKSTIINHLMETAVQATAATGKADKGHHTTTSRQLFVTPSGAIVIDTPGMRELQLDAVDFDRTFVDIERLSASCRFGDCTHQTEPGCAVHAAIRDGTLPVERLENYRKMQREAAYQETKAKEQERLLRRRLERR